MQRFPPLHCLQGLPSIQGFFLTIVCCASMIETRLAIKLSHAKSTFRMLFASQFWRMNLSVATARQHRSSHCMFSCMHSLAIVILSSLLCFVFHSHMKRRRLELGSRLHNTGVSTSQIQKILNILKEHDEPADIASLSDRNFLGSALGHT